jgi:hypothetical protein
LAASAKGAEPRIHNKTKNVRMIGWERQPCFARAARERAPAARARKLGSMTFSFSGWLGCGICPSRWG